MGESYAARLSSRENGWRFLIGHFGGWLSQEVDSGRIGKLKRNKSGFYGDEARQRVYSELLKFLAR